MRRKPITIVSLLLIMILTATTTFAANIRFGTVTFSLGSLIADGSVKGLSKNQSVTVVLDAHGTPKVVCVRDDDDEDGPHEVSVANPPQVWSQGRQKVKANSKGTAPFHLVAKNPKLTPAQAGCPHGDDDDEWKVKVLSVSWTSAVITVKGGSTNLLQQPFSCKTTATSVKCKKLHDDNDDDD